ncbi:hypothetical protein PUV54_11905 [Hyphococcus flavus]|uniref:Uncharacterized protein n=1 Tax=Hyphococcus flavus TaxID=1866326 RepID=A0AAF0CES6_9PROT|nr:hypothetical protein [Hyphococcus flavus]WDI30659.1 hypothetical protein PUV54_11905 [Hyphococcus flavus]
MAYEIDLPGYAAIPAILAIAGAAFIMKPEDLRRDPLLELQGMIGIAQKYEVMYARCADGSDNATMDAAGVATGFTGGYTHDFPGRSDEDAANFVKQARPQCEVASLYRLDRRLTGSSSANRWRRTRVEV